MKASEASSPASSAQPPRSATAARHSRPAERFTLTGPTRRLDPRTHAARRDVADLALAGELFAPHYARAEPRACVAPSAMLHEAPEAAATAVSQLLHGEAFAVIDFAGGWAWGYCAHDHYVGYVAADALELPKDATHIVTAPLALAFSGPSIKAPVIAELSLGARLAGVAAEGFLATALGHVHLRHVAPVDHRAADPVAVAEALLGQPYRWGGRGAGGIDCSGLVQLALGRSGVAVPRDTDQQRAAIGVEIAADDPLRRGDILFFPGHVGLMIDSTRLIHANAHWMAVTIEPLADVIARLAPDHAQPVLARRRLA